ncbi:MAG: glycosyltransferase family 2 protein, partial [Proteobacteria bacterium]|nr:glycosyltransferase family 2 protein [Pseudomonadota bacterium]
MSQIISRNVLVSFIIVNWNKAHLTYDCMTSASSAAGDISHEIIVVDNGSDEFERGAIASACSALGARLIALNRNLFFGEANNIGVEASAGEFVLLLNNDASISNAALTRLLDALVLSYRAAAVGPRFVYPDGRLQEAGCYLRPDGWSIQHGKQNAPIESLAGPGVHVVDYCSAACLLMRREIFLNMGGFDPAFDPAYYEDADLCLRLRSQGLLTYYCGDATVVHMENETSKTLWQKEQITKHIEVNRQKMLSRWGRYLAERIEGPINPPAAGSIDWTAEPAMGSGPRLIVRGPGTITDSEL